jgi:hypothetical protein
LATDADELIERFASLGTELTPEKAQRLINDAVSGEFSATSLVTDLGIKQAPPNEDESVEDAAVEEPFSPDEIALVLSETSLTPHHRRGWGQLNINTVPPETLYAMFEGTERLVDSLLSLRTRRANGLPSQVDFWDLEGAEQATLEQILPLFGTSSNVFTISSRGESSATGEVAEINVVVDRSSLPVRILEYREN